MEYILQEMASELVFSDKIRKRSGHSIIHHQNAVHHEMLELPSSVTSQVHRTQHAPNWKPNFKSLSKWTFSNIHSLMVDVKYTAT